MGSSPEKVVANIGKQLAQQTHPTKDFLVQQLSQAANALSEIDQDSSLKSSIKPLSQFLQKHGLQNGDKDIKLWVASCLCEIIRILAPDPSFNNKTFKAIFELFIGIFMELAHTRSAYFSTRVRILKTVAKLECCRRMLDLGCDDLILKMFKIFFSVVSGKHEQILINEMRSIMLVILNEEDTPQPLLEVILQNLANKREGPAPASYHLAVALVQNCTEKIRPAICGFFTSCILDRENVRNDLKESYHEIILEVFKCAPDMLSAIIPNLVQELVTDQVDVRLKSVNLIGKLLVLPVDIDEKHNLLVELLKRFADKSAEVRISVIRAVKTCYLANPRGVEAHKILSSIEARLLDLDTSVRLEAVAVVCDLAKSNMKGFPEGLIARAIDRLRDKMTSVRKEASRKLLEVYHDYCIKCVDGQMMLSESYEQIPLKLLILSLDNNLKEFRPQSLELLLSDKMFPASFSVIDRTRHWIYLYSLFTPAHIKSLNLILCQKRRFQKEMQIFLSLCRKNKGIDSEEVNVRLKNTFRRMSAAFPNPFKAEESFSKLIELNEIGIFDLFLQLLEEPAFLNAKALRDNYLKKIGEKHPHFEFLEALFLKCSNSIFGSEHVHSILDHISGSRHRNNSMEESSINLLSDICRNFPLLLRGSEHQFKLLILEEDFCLHGKLIQILSNVGCFITMQASDIYPLLERLCLEGTRGEAKSAVSVIAALVGPSEQFLVEELCQKLVASLWSGKNIPTVLQSLGCISQHFVSEFQKHRNEVSSYIRGSIFERNLTDDAAQFNEITECGICFGCKMKIYGLKALVKSVLQKQDVHLEDQINNVLNVLSKVLLTAKFADAATACKNDVAHVKLVAAKSVLRLSRWWDVHISPQLFQSTIMMAKDSSSSIHKTFLDKIHKLLKGHAIPSKFACAFALAAASNCAEDLKDVSSKYLVEFIKEYGKTASTSLTSGTEGFSTNCAAYIVVFLLRVLAYDAEFPSVNSCSEEVFAQICRPLALFLHMLVDIQFVEGDADLIQKTFSYLLSIFRAVIKAEDAIDADQTPKLHILANIGLSILKSLKNNDINLAPAPGVVLLPSSLYKIATRRKTEDDCCTLEFVLNDHFMTKLINALDFNLTQLSSATVKQAKKCIKGSLQDQNVVDLSVSKHLELSRNVIRQETVAEKVMVETHVLEACNSGKQPTGTVYSSLRKTRLQDASVEELDMDDSANLEALSAKDKIDSNSANMALFGTVSDISTEVPLLLSQQDERKRKGTCESAERRKSSKAKLRDGCTSDGSTVSILQQSNPKTQIFAYNVKAAVFGSGGVATDMQGKRESKRKVLVDGTNTLQVNGSRKHGQANKIFADMSASDVSEVDENAIALRTRRRKV